MLFVSCVTPPRRIEQVAAEHANKCAGAPSKDG